MQNLIALSLAACIISLANFACADDINISSDIVEFNKSSNSISFTNNVRIDSEYINVLASQAVLDNDKDTISVYGNPSLISSNNPNNLFKGQAKKIIIFTDEKIHLIGEASMNYENINISSNKILFNPQTGSLSSQE